MLFKALLISSPCSGTFSEAGCTVVFVPYAVLALLAIAGKGVADPARRDERLADGVAGISASVMAGDAPLLEAALLVARVLRLVDMMCVNGGGVSVEVRGLRSVGSSRKFVFVGV
jgi:hypothetical protein